MLATFFSSKYNSILLLFVVLPIIAKSKFHLSNIFLASSSLPFSKVMIHQVSSGTRGHIADNRISHLESEKYNYVLFNMLADYSDKSFNEVMEVANRDKWFTAEEILKFGLIDEVVYPEDREVKGLDKYLEGFDKYYQKLMKK